MEGSGWNPPEAVLSAEHPPACEQIPLQLNSRVKLTVTIGYSRCSQSIMSIDINFYIDFPCMTLSNFLFLAMKNYKIN
jgi:hypothetical protein